MIKTLTSSTPTKEVLFSKTTKLLAIAAFLIKDVKGAKMTNFLGLYNARPISYITTPLAGGFGVMVALEGAKELRKIYHFVKDADSHAIVKRAWKTLQKTVVVALALIATIYTSKYLTPTLLKNPSVQTTLYHAVLLSCLPYWAKELNSN